MKKTIPERDARCVQPEVDTLLVRAGLRRTKERRLVLETLMRLHTPRSVDELMGEVASSVNKVTLYRMLEQFVAAGLVERVVLHDGVRRYEYQEEHHHHITCTVCGARARVEVPERLLVRAVRASTKDFPEVTAHTLEFYGLCISCAQVGNERSG